LFAWRARSNVLLSCALALLVGWIFSICWFFIGGKYGISWGFAVVDAGLAAYFWRMSVRRLFPTILFYLHASMVVYYFYVSIVGSTRWWMAVFANRIVELALIYIIFGSLYRMRVRRRKKFEARDERASEVAEFAAEFQSNSFAQRRGDRFFQLPR